jgi:hypothetical protein
MVFDTMMFGLPTMADCWYATLSILVYSSETFVGLHHSKSDIAEYQIALIKHLQTQTGKTLKRFHSDNGTEIKNDTMTAFFTSQGTLQTFSTPYTPQHNSIVERKNRTVIDGTCAIMHHAGAYPQLYGEAMACFVYVLNRTTNSRSELITPREHRTGIKPDVSYFHVWGCDVYYHHRKKHRQHKFDAKGITGIFVGYDEDNASYYRVFNVDDEEVIITRDVIFHDDRFNEMQRLRAVMHSKTDHAQYDDFDITRSLSISKRINIDDSLPDDVPAEAIADMFPQGKNEIIKKIERVTDERMPVTMMNNRVFEETDRHRDEDQMNVEDRLTVKVNDDNSRSVNERRSTRVRRPANPRLIDGYSYMISSELNEPLSYHQAIQSNDGAEWLKAINDELEAHEKNTTWSVVRRSGDMNVIGSKWVFKIKRDKDGKPSKYKARLVAKGFNQQQGIDYQETFAPVLKYKSLRIILALSLHAQNTIIEQLDVKTAFLNATIHEDVYVSPPDGMNIPAECVLKLNRALYGIKQAPREWHAEIHTFLLSLGYVSCRKDSCLYVKHTSAHMIIIGLFVDDIIVSYIRDDVNVWLRDKQLLMSKYEMSELGDVQHILGMKINREDGCIRVDQDVYIRDKLREFDFDNARSISTPEALPSTHAHTTNKSSPSLSAHDVSVYRQMVGSLMYACCSTRPDITHATNMVARRMSDPSEDDMIKVKRIFRYLTASRHFALLYQPPNQHQGGVVKLHGYCDADWGGDLTDRKSTTGYCTFVNNNLISWQSKKQTTVALSSCEAEYMAINDIAKEIMWMRMLMKELKIEVETPTIIYVDNQSAIKISENDSAHDRTKHIDIRHYYIRDLIDNGEIKLVWVPTADQLADIFTKSLSSSTFTSIRDRLMNSSNNNNNHHNEHDE